MTLKKTLFRSYCPKNIFELVSKSDSALSRTLQSRTLLYERQRGVRICTVSKRRGSDFSLSCCEKHYSQTTRGHPWCQGYPRTRNDCDISFSDGYDDDDSDIYDNVDNCASCYIPSVYDALDVCDVTDDSDVCYVNDILEHCDGKQVMPTMLKCHWSLQCQGCPWRQWETTNDDVSDSHDVLDSLDGYDFPDALDVLD